MVKRNVAPFSRGAGEGAPRSGADEGGADSVDLVPSRGRKQGAEAAAPPSSVTLRVPPSPASREKDRLRLWLRLLRATRSIEAELRERLKSQFASTLPRFDVMAALERTPDGMVMGDLSRFLLVSNGNVTGIVDRLVADGHVERTTRNGDRRTSMVRLSSAGRAAFATIAAAHETWIEELLGDVDEAQARQLSAMLKPFSSNWEMRE